MFYSMYSHLPSHAEQARHDKEHAAGQVGQHPHTHTCGVARLAGLVHVGEVRIVGHVCREVGDCREEEGVVQRLDVPWVGGTDLPPHPGNDEGVQHREAQADVDDLHGAHRQVLRQVPLGRGIHGRDPHGVVQWQRRVACTALHEHHTILVRVPHVIHEATRVCGVVVGTVDHRHGLRVRAREVAHVRREPVFSIVRAVVHGSLVPVQGCSATERRRD